jgi:hypothetical protein
MIGHVNYRTAIILGGTGSVLPYAYPFFCDWLTTVYRLASSGRLAPEMYEAIFGGRANAMVADVGLLMAPLAWAMFFTSLYRETSAPARRRRQIASGIAAGLMLTAAASFVCRDMLFSGVLGAGENPLLSKTAVFVNATLYVGWSFLMGVFAFRKSPLRSSVTPRLALFLAIGNTLLAGMAAYDVWGRREYLLLHHQLRGVFLVIDAVQVVSWAAVIIFLAVLRREFRVSTGEASSPAAS